MLTLVLGGIKAGKSREAERLAAAAGPRVAYVATGVATDAEMAARIGAHQARRPLGWETIEAPFEVAAAVAAHLDWDAVLVDEWGTLVANHLVRLWEPADVPGSLAAAQAAVGVELEGLVNACAARGRVIVVSSEVGWSPVPPNAMARVFGDLMGASNQRLAAAAARVVVCLAGIPVAIKGGDGR